MKPKQKPAIVDPPKPREKKTEDIEQIMNNIETRNISKIVGIDPSQTKSFSWFFQLIIKLRLPPHITRHLNSQKDNLIYFNELTHEETYQHPSLNIIKTFFYQKIADNKTVYTFLDKQGKLLPFVEERMLKQCIGINSKRREAEKVNLQRDQTGRMVMSKLQRITPDFKTLLASRSYMLKMLVEKVFTKKQILGKGKRAAAYTSVLSEYKHLMKQGLPDKDEDEEITEDNLSLYQQIFEQAAIYYSLQYGNLQNIPTRIVHSKQYLESSPQNVLKNIFLLNVRKQSIELYWLARIMDCLPLPPNWTKKRGTSYDSYLYEPEKFIFDIHPSYIYIMRQMNAFRSKFSVMSNARQNYYLSMRQLNFYDYFEREYSVDMYGYIEKAEIDAKEQDHEKKKQRKIVQSLQVSDWMVLEGINNCPITPKTYVLIEYIQQFWRMMNFNQQPWFPAISPYGEVVWSSNINSKSIHFCPYQALLSNLYQIKSIMLPHISQSILKLQFRQQQPKKDEIQDEELLLSTNQLIKQQQSFLNYYIQHLDIPVAYPYQIKSYHQLLDQYNYYDQIFVCPFQLDQGIVPYGEKVPLWLEKVHAKNYANHQTNLLTFNPEYYTKIKQAVSNYALDMVGQHEPHLIESIQHKINRISSPEELIKFLYHITDLDLREQRKRQYLQSLNRDDSQDIFGSELSQVQVIEQIQTEENKQEIEADQSSHSEKVASIRQKSIQQQESSEEELPQVEIDTTSVKSEIIVITARKQYAFLQDFKKKKFRRNYDLQPLKQQKLAILIKDCAKTKTKKCKYKTGPIKQKIQKQLQIAKVLHLPHHSIKHQQVDRIKKNFITTHMRSGCLPSFVDLKSMSRFFQLVSRQNQTEIAYSEMTDYNQFYSQTDQYEIDDIEEIIKQYRTDKARQKKPKIPTVKTLNDPQQTNDSIQLEPIYQIKPQILHDPVLIHVKRLSGEINQFRSTFHNNKLKNVSSYKELPLNIRFKMNSLQKLNSQQTHNTPTLGSIRNGSLKMERIETVSKFNHVIRRQKNYSTEKFSNTQQPFHRICLQKTASHFLQKQVFLRKADIISIEARKSLLSKGRGMQTLISKQY